MNTLDLFSILEMAKKSGASTEQIAELIKATATDVPATDVPATIDSLVLSKSEKFSNALNKEIIYIKVDGYNIDSFVGLHGLTISDLGDLGYKRSVTEILEQYSVLQYACRWVNSKGATRHYCYLAEQIKALREKDAAFKAEMDQHIRVQKTAKPKKELQDLQITW